MAGASTEKNTEEPSVVVGSLNLGLFVAVFTSSALALAGRDGWAYGFGIGAALSLLSVFSLACLVPRLLTASSSGVSQFLLALLLFAKLPLYAAALYAVTQIHGVDAVSAFPGILVMPFAITLKAAAAPMWQAAAAGLRRSRIRRGGWVVKKSERTGWARRRPAAETASEQG